MGVAWPRTGGAAAALGAMAETGFMKQRQEETRQEYVGRLSGLACMRRRANEPVSHYFYRLKCIRTLIENEHWDVHRVEALSSCFCNVKFLNAKYCEETMALIKKYDPDESHGRPLDRR